MKKRKRVMRTKRNRLNLPAPVEPARKAVAEKVFSEPEPEQLAQFLVSYRGYISNNYDILYKLIPIVS